MSEILSTQAFLDREAAAMQRDTAIKHLATTIAAYGDAEAAGWTEEAANAFFGRCLEPLFVTDNARFIEVLRSDAKEAGSYGAESTAGA